MTKQLQLELFGPGDKVRLKMKTRFLGHCGHQYAFEGGFDCTVTANEVLTILMSRTKNDKREYLVEAVDTDRVKRTIWLDEDQIIPAVSA